MTAGDDSSLLAYIVQADRLYVEVALPEADAELVRAAHDANPGAREGERHRHARTDHRLASVDRSTSSPRVDDSTGTVAIRAVLDNGGGGRLLAGRVVRARDRRRQLPGSFVIPKRALMHGAQGPFVWVIGEGEQVAATPVQLGPSSGNDVVVASGLTAGDRVVVDGILKVQPGAAVHATMLNVDGAPANAPGKRRASAREWKRADTEPAERADCSDGAQGAP